MGPHLMHVSFELCALYSLITWKKKEEALHDSISKNLNCENLRTALRYFNVARNFKGLNRKRQATNILNALLEARTLYSELPPNRVIHLANNFQLLGFQNNISAASKLLWLSARNPYVIFDARVASALSSMDNTAYNAQGYLEFYRAWKNGYQRDVQKIQSAIEKLPKICRSMQIRVVSDSELSLLMSKKWFKERIYDRYLWELGGDQK